MKKYFYFIVFPIILLLWSCRDNVFDSDNTPEEVLQRYQHHIDNNEFGPAKDLSTDGGRIWIEELEQSLSGELLDSTILTTTFNQIECEIVQDTALCVCDLEDEFERYDALFRLVKVKNKWLVDAPDEVSDIEYQDIENMLEEILKRS